MTIRVRELLPINPDVGLKTFLEKDPSVVVASLPSSTIANRYDVLMDTLYPLVGEAQRGPELAFVWRSPFPMSWMVKQSGKSMSSRMQGFGEYLERKYPGLREATINTPVVIRSEPEWPSGVGEYIKASYFDPYGQIILPEKGAALFDILAHEAVHRVRDVRKKEMDKLAEELMKKADERVLLRLSGWLGRRIEKVPHEFLPYIFGTKYAPSTPPILRQFEEPDVLRALELFLKNPERYKRRKK